MGPRATGALGDREADTYARETAVNDNAMPGPKSASSLVAKVEPLRNGMLVDGPTRYVEVSYAVEGGIQFSAQDLGWAPQVVFGRSDYEFSYSVPADRVGDFAALVGIDPDDPIRGLMQRWTGERRFGELQTVMRETGYVKFSSF